MLLHGGVHNFDSANSYSVHSKLALHHQMHTGANLSDRLQLANVFLDHSLVCVYMRHTF